MHQKMPSFLKPWFQIQVDVQRIVLGEDFWEKAQIRFQSMPQKVGGAEIKIEYDRFQGR